MCVALLIALLAPAVASAAGSATLFFTGALSGARFVEYFDLTTQTFGPDLITVPTGAKDMRIGRSAKLGAHRVIVRLKVGARTIMRTVTIHVRR